MVTFEQLLRIYLQEIKNIDDPDDLMTETLLVLSTRDGFEDLALTKEQLLRLDRADDQLVKRWEVLAEALPFPAPHPRAHWWWFLHEGPQVREQAQALAAD